MYLFKSDFNFGEIDKNFYIVHYLQIIGFIYLLWYLLLTYLAVFSIITD